MDSGARWLMMPPNERKHCNGLLPDMLSNLPENVIDVILMRLPYADVVRTSVLSKKWRNNWCRLTELKLDGSILKTKKDMLCPKIKLRKITNQLMNFHKGSITKFTLDISHLDSCLDIDNFISFLSRKDIQHLVLQLPFIMNICALPSSIFTCSCSQLRHLDLRYCSMSHLSAFQGFDRLISLKLYQVSISSKLLESLISRCPLLEQLELRRELRISEILDMIEINAPMLRLFDFIGDIGFICLKNVPRLVKVSLLGDDMQAEDLDFAKVFEFCPAVEHLSFDFISSWFFAEEGFEAPTRLPFNLNSVKRFHLPNILLMESYKLSYALCLMRSFPYLEYLEIQVSYEDESESEESVEIQVSYEDESESEESVEIRSLSSMTFNHLREVKVEHFNGGASEMQFIKFLLANSPMLERMIIELRYLDADMRLEISAEVSNFLRASPKVEIVCKLMDRVLGIIKIE